MSRVSGRGRKKGPAARRGCFLSFFLFVIQLSLSACAALPPLPRDSEGFPPSDFYCKRLYCVFPSVSRKEARRKGANVVSLVVRAGEGVRETNRMTNSTSLSSIALSLVGSLAFPDSPAPQPAPEATSRGISASWRRNFAGETAQGAALSTQRGDAP